MSDISESPSAVPAARAAQQKNPARRSIAGQIWRRSHQFRQRIKDDWHQTLYGPLGLALLLISSLIIVAYYINHPTPETDPDTPSYLAVAQQIMTSGKLVDPTRLPGYPLFIALVFLFSGQGNLAAVSITQGILFVLAIAEIYIITCMITHHAWIGLAVGLVVASNTYVLSFIKPVLSEGFSLWVVVSLALALVLFVRTLRVSLLWLVAALLLLAVMTRAEWDYAPVLIFAFLLIVAARHGRFRRLAPHALAAVLLVYSVLGLYIYGNATLNGFAGVTVIQRANLLGKVLQYNMQSEAPPQYAALAQEANAYRATGAIDPWGFAVLHPEVRANNWALANAYATAIVEQHPLEFTLKTVPLVFTSSTGYYEASRVDAQGPFGGVLFDLKRLSLKTILLYPLFPFLALVWLGLLVWRRTARLPPVEMMGALSLVGLYELALISAGGYASYMRLHTAFEPLMFVVVCGSLLLLLPLSAELIKKNSSLTIFLARLWPRIWWVWGVLIVGGLVVSGLLTLLLHGAGALAHPSTWSGFSPVFHHYARSGAAAGLLALLTYWAYQAHRHQAAGPGTGKAAYDLLPEQEIAPMNDHVDPLPGEISLARQPEG